MFDLELPALLFVFLMAFLAGVISAISGGGGLLSLPSYIFVGVPVHYALGTDRFAAVAGGLVAGFKFYRKGLVDVKLLIPSVISTIVGSVIGTGVALLASEYIMQRVLLIVLPLVGFYVFKNKRLESGNKPLPHKKAVTLAIVVSFVIGWYNGFYGPGSGIFLLLIYNRLLNMDILLASGNSKIVGLVSTVTSTLIFIAAGKVLILLALVASCFNMAGSYFGANLAIRKGAGVIRPSLLIMLVLIFIKAIKDVL
ncbi:MAG: TSUP family transporter [Deferribacteraceae bacterium]|jgi:uncharacterized membrane protein YfcA|nr:TSUP family transporter [Deferribacteraceae bacterium]